MVFLVKTKTIQNPRDGHVLPLGCAKFLMRQRIYKSNTLVVAPVPRDVSGMARKSKARLEVVEREIVSLDSMGRRSGLSNCV